MPVLMSTLIFHKLIFSSKRWFFTEVSVCTLSVRCTIFSTGPYHLLAKSTVAVVKMVLKTKIEITCTLYCIL